MKITRRSSITIFALLLGAARLTAQSVPSTVNYQGRLTDNSPQQVAVTGTAGMKFEIWSCAACVAPGSSPLWSEPASGTLPVAVTNGIFSVVLGASGVPIPVSIFSGGTQRWLQVYVNGEALVPRQELTSVGWANQADSAVTATTAISATSAATAATATSATTATTAATAINSQQLGNVAASGYQLATSATCAAGLFLNSITSAGGTNCASPPATPVPNPLWLTQSSSTVTIYGNNTGTNAGVFGDSSASNGVVGRSYSATDSGVYGENDGGGYGVAGATNSNSAAGVVGTNWGSGQGMFAQNLGGGEAAEFFIASPANVEDAVYSHTAGTGNALSALSAGGSGVWGASQSDSIYSAGVLGVNWGLGSAGYFATTNPPNAQPTLYADNQAKGSAGYFLIQNSASTSPAVFATTDGVGPVIEVAGANALSTPLLVESYVGGQVAKLQIWKSGGVEVGSVGPAGGFNGNGAGLTNLDPTQLSNGLASIDVTGNAATVSNGVYTTGSYSNPAWLTSLAGAKITGSVAQATNAGAVTNGLYTTGSYSDPAWLTSLAGAKITGSVAQAGNSSQLGGTAASGYQLSTVKTCGAGLFLDSITAAGATTCASPPSNNLAPPVTLNYGGSSTILTANNSGTGSGLSAITAANTAILGNVADTLHAGILGVSGGGAAGFFLNTGVSGYSAGGIGTGGLTATGTGVMANASGSGTAVSAASDTGKAGVFTIANALSASVALTATTAGTNDAIYGVRA